MANFEISKVTSNGSWWVPGDKVTIGFTLKNTSGSKVKKMALRICVDKKDVDPGVEFHHFITLAMILGINITEPASFTLANKASKAFSSTFVVTEEIANLFAEFSAHRSMPIYVDVSASDAYNSGFGNAIELSGLSVVNKRFSPQIAEFRVERAEDGAKDEEGESLLTSIQLRAAEGCENYFTAHLYRAQDAPASTDTKPIDLTNRIQELLNGIYENDDILPGLYSNGSQWNLMLVFGDAFESVSFRYPVSRAFANMHLSGAPSGGVCFGGFSSSYGDPKLESYYPIYAYAGIHGVTNHVAGEIKTGGLWIDKKPNYINRIAATITAGSTVEVATLPDAIDVMHHISGTFVGADGKVRTIPFAYYGDASWNVACNVDKNTGEVVLRMGDSYSGSYDVNLHLEYTKVNDEIVDTETHERVVDSDDYTLLDNYNNTLMSRRE